MTALRRHHGLLFAMDWLVSACSNPQWDGERFHVTGVLAGKSCTMEYNGLPGLPASSAKKVDLASIEAADIPADNLKMIDCGGMVISLQGPRGALPAPGTFAVTDNRRSAPPPGTVAVDMEDPRISAGHWPLVGAGMVNFTALSGTVWIDSVAPKTVYGRFDVVGRRIKRSD